MVGKCNGTAVIQGVQGSTEGPDILPMIIICKSLLSSISSFNVKDSDYKVLKSYSIVPLSNSIISSNNINNIAEIRDVI